MRSQRLSLDAALRLQKKNGSVGSEPSRIIWRLSPKD